MKALVVYDSNFGNTELIAHTIAGELQCRAQSVNKVTRDSLKDIELLIIGSPINAWRATPKVRAFIKSIDANELKGKKAAAFDTRIKIFISGNAARKISKKLAAKGAAIISEPQGFYVKDSQGPLMEGELENAKKWANAIIKKLNQ